MRDYREIKLYDDETDDLDAHVANILEERAKEKAAEAEMAEDEAEMEPVE